MDNQTSQEFQQWATTQLPRLGVIPFKCPECQAVLDGIGETCPKCTQPVLRNKSVFSRLASFEQEFSMGVSGIVFGVLIIGGAFYLKAQGTVSSEVAIIATLIGCGFFFKEGIKYFGRSVSAVAGTTMTGERYFILGDRYVSKGEAFTAQAVMAYAKGISMGASIIEHGYQRPYKLWTDSWTKKQMLSNEEWAAYRDLLAGAFLLQFILADASKLELSMMGIYQTLLHDDSPARDVAVIMVRNNPHWLNIRRMERLVSNIQGAAPKIAAILRGPPSLPTTDTDTAIALPATPLTMLSPQQNPQLTNDKALIIFVRPKAHIGSAVSAHLFDCTSEDDQFIATLKAGEKIAYFCLPGHRCLISISHCPALLGSDDGVRLMDAKIEGGRVYYAAVTPKMVGLGCFHLEIHPIKENASKSDFKFSSGKIDKWLKNSRFVQPVPAGIQWAERNREHHHKLRQEGQQKWKTLEEKHKQGLSLAPEDGLGACRT